ncbi:MAG: RecQ family ATP-dependent DNA helicase [Anaerolineales bacterium]|nr:RecQ family ATP-dependent DNA helicase [Anaerolineales bacterium]
MTEKSDKHATNTDNSNDCLSALDISPLDAVSLSTKARSRLLNFLLRWDHYAEVEQCLDVVMPVYPSLVSLMDIRIRAQMGIGETEAALATMAIRQQRKTSVTAKILEARIHLERGDTGKVMEIALALNQEASDKGWSWGLLGEGYFLGGEVDKAEGAYRRQLELSPSSSSPLLGLMDVYTAREDWISASAYAVRALTLNPDYPPPVDSLRRLSCLFKQTGDLNHTIEIDEALAQRYRQELVDLKTFLSEELTGKSPTEGDVGRVEVEDVEPLPVSTLPISDGNRTRIEKAAEKYFPFDQFLPGQVETMSAMLDGHDVLALLPTGGGKSLCYQLPAMMEEKGTTVVISPLIALMKDQVDSMPPEVQKVTTAINSTLEWDKLCNRLRSLAQGRYRMVYVAPERLRQLNFLDALKESNLVRLVIDEAHCVSIWGHDFRPDYLFIAHVRKVLGNPPLLALTATAPLRVRRDIIQRLGKLEVVSADIHRANLRLEVVHARNNDEKMRHLLAICQAESGSGIVYAGTRDRCEMLSGVLNSNGISASYYHAGIPNRSQVQDDFMSGRTRVVVATVAFGMGIDKSDIRFIVHYFPPPSLESYYQEAGRAGRDGLAARCVLFFSSSDKTVLTRRANEAVLSIEFLRCVYGAISKRAKRAAKTRNKRYLQVAADDLRRDIKADETQIRVAISLLEAAGLLRRHFDAPRTAVVTLLRRHTRSQNEQNLKNEKAFTAFCDAARLIPGQPLHVDLIGLAETIGVEPENIEMCALNWSKEHLIEYRPVGRDLLLECLPTPADSAERVKNILERYTTIQIQRVEEITAYARTRRCRHGHISVYLGGRSIKDCGACDNCLGLSVNLADLPESMPEIEQFRTILNCVAGARWGIGPYSLSCCLRGDKRAPDWTRKLDQFRALAFRSQAALDNLIARLIEAGMLQSRQLDHGGAALSLTERGQRARDDKEILGQLLP